MTTAPSCLQLSYFPPKKTPAARSATGGIVSQKKTPAPGTGVFFGTLIILYPSLFVIHSLGACHSCQKALPRIHTDQHGLNSDRCSSVQIRGLIFSSLCLCASVVQSVLAHALHALDLDRLHHHVLFRLVLGAARRVD